MKRIVWLGAVCCAVALGQINVRGTAAGTGEYNVRPLRTTPNVAWEARPGFRDFGAMVISGNVIVTGNITGKGGVFGFDAATGRRLWTVPGGMTGEPAVDAKAAYVVNAVDGVTHRLSSLDLKTGRKLWSVQEEYLGTHDGAPLVAGGRVFLANLNGTVKAYEAGSGKPLWEHRYSPNRGTCPTPLALADGVLYFGGGEVGYARSQGRFLWAVDATTGKELWRYQAKPETYSNGGECVTAPAVADGIVVTTADYAMFALDARNGTLLWKREGMRTVNGQSKHEQLSEPLIAGGIVYSFMQDGLSGWDLRTGRAAFDFPGDFGRDAGANRMAAAGGVLYFMANLPGDQGPDAWKLPLHAMDLTTRQILWKHRVNRPSRFASIGQWRTRWILPVDGALYYENESILVKLQ